MPVERAYKFSLVVNLKTAEALGLTLSPLLLWRADEVLKLGGFAQPPKRYTAEMCISYIPR